jgi:hypothetical protein
MSAAAPLTNADADAAPASTGEGAVPSPVVDFRARFGRAFLHAWHASGQPRRWPLSIALLALAGAGVLGWLLAPQWRLEAETWRMRSLAQPVPAAARAAPAGTALPAPRPAALPSASEASARAARLLQLARAHGVTVVRLRESAPRPGALQVEVSAKATYPALRRFIAAALQEDAALDLQRLRLQRAQAETAELDIESQWAFWHRREGAAALPGGAS